MAVPLLAERLGVVVRPRPPPAGAREDVPSVVTLRGSGAMQVPRERSATHGSTIGAVLIDGNGPNG